MDKTILEARPEIITNQLSEIDWTKAVIYDSHLLKTYRACNKKFDWFELQHIVAATKKAAPSFGIAMHEGIATFRIARKEGKKYPEAFEEGQKSLLAAYAKHMPPEHKAEALQDHKRSPGNALRLFGGFCEHFERFAYEYLYVEVPLAMLLGSVTLSDGRKLDVIYVGIIDCVLKAHGTIYVNDIKSTGWNIDAQWLDGFKMDQGLLGYTIAARELLGIDTHHGVIHAMWVQGEAKNPSKAKPLDEYYHTKEVYWDDDQISEWTTNTLQTIQEIETKKLIGGPWIMDWGQNCGAFGGCDYRPLCSTTPRGREQRVSLDYTKAIWSPLEDERLQKMEI